MLNHALGLRNVFGCKKIPKHTYETLDLHHVIFSTAGQSSAKPPLLILHGILSSMDMWKKKAQAIHDETGRTVITVDARNHGLSPHSPLHTYMHMAHDTARLINKLGLSKVSVLGHSMGGRTAMALSLLYPDLTASVIVGDISPGRTSKELKEAMWNLMAALSSVSRSLKPEMSKAAMWNLMAALSSVSRSLKPEMSKAMVYKIVHTKLMSTCPDIDTRKFYLRSLVQTHTGGFDWSFKIQILIDQFQDVTTFPAELKGLQYHGPVFFIAGGKSGYIDKTNVHDIKDFFPSSSTLTVEGVGHSFPYRYPEKYLEIVHKFLRQH